MKRTGKNNQISKSGEMVLNNYSLSDLTRNQIVEIIKLMNNTWPNNDNSLQKKRKWWNFMFVIQEKFVTASIITKY